MAKNIMLLFLSDVKTFESNIRVTKYEDVGETETTNESAVRYLSKKKETKLDKIFCFATQKVQKNITVKIDDKITDYKEDGKTFTHLEYFKKRVKDDINGEVDEAIVTCEFNENAEIQATMSSVIEMASMIQNYIGELTDNEVTLHVDMTGGLRHASLMMLVITRLIQYSGVKIGNILYSNLSRGIVEESNEIYNLFDVISGAYEFVSFGSVDAIQAYFKKIKPEGALKDLLDAMERFSNAIKICQTSVIEGELKNLNERIETFAKVENKNLNEKLFANLVETIQKEYGQLLSQNVDRIDIIRWCMAKGFWQQVLTLCTEWIPEILVDFEIYYAKDKKIQADANAQGENYRNWKQNLVVNYSLVKDHDKNINDRIIKQFFKVCLFQCNQLANNKITSETVIKDFKNIGKLSAFFKENDEFLKNFPKCATISKLKCKYNKSSHQLAEIYPTFGGVIEKIRELAKNASNIQNLSIPLDSLPVFVFEKLTANQLKIVFDVELNDNVIDYVTKHSFTENKGWDKRKAAYFDLLEAKKTFSNADESTTMELLKGYYSLRNKRNQINHASHTANNEINDLKTMVEKYLEKLEPYRKNLN